MDNSKDSSRPMAPEDFTLVVVESPFAHETEEGIEHNLGYLRACMADCLARGESPYASHGLLTQKGVLDDRIPEERRKGINAGLAWGAKADKSVVYIDLGITKGMVEGIERAEKAGRPFEKRSIPGWAPYQPKEAA